MGALTSESDFKQGALEMIQTCYAGNGNGSAETVWSSCETVTCGDQNAVR